MSQVAAPSSLEPLLRRLGLADVEPAGALRVGRLLRAHRRDADSPVLLRVLTSEECGEALCETFVAEAEQLRKASVPATVTPIECGRDHAHAFALYADEGFRPFATAGERIGWVDRLHIARSAASSLAALHDAGAIHGRVDLCNLWVNLDRLETRWADPWRASNAMSSLETRDSRETYPCSPEFAAPEMTGRLEATVDQRSDLYCLGGVLYAVLTGRPPFTSPDPIELMHSHMAREVVPAAAVDPRIPQALSDVMQRLLAKMPSARYQHARGLLYDLDRCIEGLDGDDRILPALKVGERDTHGTFVLPDTPLGRDREIELIRGLSRRSEAGDVAIALLVGPAGSGKTTLAKRALAGGSGLTVAAKFEQIGHNQPYSFINQAVAGLVELILASPEEEVEAWRQRLLEAVGANLGLVIGLVPTLELIVGAQREVPHLPASESKQRMRMALHAFLRAFCRPGMPLRLFLDDLQWADGSSLELLESLVSDARLAHLLIIAASRTAPAGGIAAEPQKVLGGGIFPLHRVVLTPLPLVWIAEWLALTVRRPVREVLGLARLVLRKTSGNPFFIGQFLRFLYGDKLLSFDYGADRWEWDLDRIQEQGITDDVIALMQMKLDELPAPTRHLLAIAALIGNAFDVGTLSIAAGRSRRALLRGLGPAIEAGLVNVAPKPRSQIGRANSDAGLEIRFAHDQVQQAACSGLATRDLDELRLSIGWRLHATLAQRADALTRTAAATNLNRSAHLVSTPEEQVALAELNLTCARHARENSAFAQALEYAVAGLRLLQPEHWDSSYDLQLGLHAQAFECAYITGRLEDAEGWFASILRHARGKDEKAHAYYTRILVATSLDDSQGAIRLGVEALRMFGHSLSPFPSQFALLRELAYATLALRLRPAARLATLPRMTDPDACGAIRLLVSLCPAAYYRSPNLMSMAALRIMRLSLRHGNADESPFGYVLFGLISGAVLGRYRQGQEFGQLALKLAREGSDPLLRTKIVMIFGGFVNFWCEPIESSLQLLDESLRLALAAGDVQYANYSVLQTIFLSLARGIPLDQVMSECRSRQALTDQTKDEFTIANRRIREQFIRALRGQTVAPDSLDDEGFDELTIVQRSNASTNRTTLAYLAVVKEQLAFLSGNFERARELSEAAEKDLDALLSQIAVAEHTFYRGLILAQALAHGGGNLEHSRRGLDRAIERFRIWTENSPVNFGSQYLLLQAVRATLGDDPSAASKLFDQAIERATELRVLHVRSIAFELAGRHAFAQGRWQEGSRYIEEAMVAYSAWGATAKQAQLGGGLRVQPKPAHASSMASAPTWRFNELDRLAFERFVTSSGELGNIGDSNELCQSLMRHVIENTGATSGSMLCLVQERRLVVVAHGRSSALCVEASTNPVELEQVFSERLVRYVLRGQAPLSFTLPHQDQRFAHCDHLRDTRPASVLCVPLRAGPEPIGAVYLENVSLQNAFVVERMTFLPVIARQLAIVLQNARAFHVLAEQTRTLDDAKLAVATLRHSQSQLTKFVPLSVREGLAAHPDGDALIAREEDLTVLFVDLSGYTALVERIGSRAAQEIVERYFARYLDAIEAEVGDVNEFAGDGFMAIFRDASPIAHALRAVSAAHSVRAATEHINETAHERMDVHMGIASGPATVGAQRLELRTGSRWTWTATGSVANLAARLTHTCEAGEILLSADTARRVASAWEASPLASLSLKGFEEPVQVYRLGSRVDGGAHAVGEARPDRDRAATHGGGAS